MAEKTLDKKPDFKKIEEEIISFWQENDLFRFDALSEKPVFSIDTPPPTISGNLHIGHAFSYSQTEFIARYKRMRGFNVFYPFGFDNNGLATEKMAEKQKNVVAEKMSRQEFVKLCLEVSKKAEKEYERVWKRLGISCDWSLVYRTISREVQRYSQASFIKLFHKKNVYRKKAPTIFCPVCSTAIAQVELEDSKKKTVFAHIKFKVEDGKEIIVATTRPELLCACKAIFFNPKDKTKKWLAGKKAVVPLYNFRVPILSDKRVVSGKGTGLVMFCTFGDLTDVDWYNAYNFSATIALDKKGRMTREAGRHLEGLTISEARKSILGLLEKKGFLEKKVPLEHIVNTHERCGSTVEFFLSDQWFIKYLHLKKKYLSAGKKIKWWPKHMFARYKNWVNGLQWDWCISRQRFFGVPFPVWYCKKCFEPVVASESQLPVDPLKDNPLKPCKCGSKSFEPERDVLDTWATSSLTPLINAKWLDNKKLFEKIYPMTLRANAHDIISFWDFNTIAMCLFHTRQTPFENIMISGHGLDKHGKKMSKSKGNIVFPLKIIEKYSADALRYWAASVKLGEDLNFREEDVLQGKRFTIKLWNAARFISMHFPETKEMPLKLHLTDKWVLAKLDKSIERATKNLEKYEYSKAKKEMENFFWNTFTDFYLEMVKYRLYEEVQKSSVQYALFESFKKILFCFAPFTPFVTEKIYRELYALNEKDSIHLQRWPDAKNFFLTKKEEMEMEAVLNGIKAFRKMRKELNLSLGSEIKRAVLYASHIPSMKEAIETLKKTCRVQEIEFKKSKNFYSKLV